MTDPAICSLNAIDRLLFISLLCLASQSDDRDGTVRYVSNEALLRVSFLDGYDDLPFRGIEGLIEADLIKRIDSKTILVKNFEKRQNQAMTSAERQRQFRERKKKVTESNGRYNDSNARVDKNRVDKNNTPAKAGLKKMDIDYETGEPIPEKGKSHKREDVIKLAKLFDKMASEYSGKPIATPKSYFIILNAMKPPHNLKAKGIEKLFEDWFNNSKIKLEDKVKLNFALSAGNINAFKVLN